MSEDLNKKVFLDKPELTNQGIPPLSQDPTPPKGGVALRSARFRKGREESWKELEELLHRIDKKGLKSLTADEEVELPHLYQVAVSSLALARNTSLDRRLLMYLENLSFRAYIVVYGPRESFSRVFVNFILSSFPQAVRNLKWYILAAAIIFFSGFISSYILVSQDLNNFYDVIPIFTAPINPEYTQEEILEDEIYQKWPGFKRTFLEFANFLFTNNSKVAILGFSLSFLLGVPTVFIAWSNGNALGAMVSLHSSKDLLLPYLAWLSIHGITEILAFLLSTAAGLSIAKSIILPSPHTRLKALSIRGKEAGMVMVGVVLMLAIAAILEGGFRQLINNTPGRLVFATLTTLFWFYYFVLLGRDKTQDSKGQRDGGIK
ncbi:MAG: stage II sporulation protein M [Deltaproteobacteria bacterium]|nr:stage II sporulation protein M [Deltaproteobacteria bacterium]